MIDDDRKMVKISIDGAGSIYMIAISHIAFPPKNAPNVLP